MGRSGSSPITDEIVEKAFLAYREAPAWPDGRPTSRRYMRAALEAVEEDIEGGVLVADVTEALDAIDKYAERDMDHDLHAIVEHYRRALHA